MAAERQSPPLYEWNVPLYGGGRAGIAQKQGYHHTDYDANKGGHHPQTPSAAEFSGQIQPAHA